MRIIDAKNYEDLSRKAANIISAQIIAKPESVLGLATGSTPIGTYKQLIAWYQKGDLDFSEVTSINLDEYVGLDESSDQSYRYFMNDQLFNHVNVKKERTFVPKGVSDDIQKEAEAYDALIQKQGGIDLQLLGIGHNGHIGFNEPDDSFPMNTHVVDLGETTVKANARFFANEAEVPRKAITMGIRAIMQAKRVLLIANGADKKEIVEKALFGPVKPQVPASILQLHEDLTVITCFK